MLLCSASTVSRSAGREQAEGGEGGTAGVVGQESCKAWAWCCCLRWCGARVGTKPAAHTPGQLSGRTDSKGCPGGAPQPLICRPGGSPEGGASPSVPDRGPPIPAVPLQPTWPLRDAVPRGIHPLAQALRGAVCVCVCVSVAQRGLPSAQRRRRRSSAGALGPYAGRRPHTSQPRTALPSSPPALDPPPPHNHPPTQPRARAHTHTRHQPHLDVCRILLHGAGHGRRRDGQHQRRHAPLAHAQLRQGWEGRGGVGSGGVGEGYGSGWCGAG